MRWLVVLLISVLVASDLLGLQMSLGPGLSVKNAILYCLALALVARITLSDKASFEMPAVLVAFALLIGYAIFSWLATAFLVRYPHYDLVESAITLKASLVDPALFFFAGFSALRTSGDVRFALKAYAIAFTAANFFTITDVVGLTDFGVRIGQRGAELGRVFGVFGHANETGSLIVCLLPGVIALAVASRGVARLAWSVAALVSLAVLIMTVSRGAFVAAALGSVWAAFACRRVLSAKILLRGAMLGAGGIALVMIVVVLLHSDVATIVEDRLLGQSTAVDIDDVSSGRTAIWTAAIDRMMATPLSLLIGLGWDSYGVMPFRLATHNYYLSLWFELGIPGLALFVFLLGYVLMTARKALEARPQELRPYLLGFIFGLLPLTISVVFGDLDKPWPYVWLYTGIAMRAAVLALERRTMENAQKRAPSAPAGGQPAPRARRAGPAPVAMRRPEKLI